MENFFLKFLNIHSSWVFFPVEECIINRIYMYSSQFTCQTNHRCTIDPRCLDKNVKPVRYLKCFTQSILLYVL